MTLCTVFTVHLLPPESTAHLTAWVIGWGHWRVAARSGPATGEPPGGDGRNYQRPSRRLRPIRLTRVGDHESSSAQRGSAISISADALEFTVNRPGLLLRQCNGPWAIAGGGGGNVKGSGTKCAIVWPGHEKQPPDLGLATGQCTKGRHCTYFLSTWSCPVDH